MATAVARYSVAGKSDTCQCCLGRLGDVLLFRRRTILHDGIAGHAKWNL